MEPNAITDIVTRIKKKLTFEWDTRMGVRKGVNESGKRDVLCGSVMLPFSFECFTDCLFTNRPLLLRSPPRNLLYLSRFRPLNLHILFPRHKPETGVAHNVCVWWARTMSSGAWPELLKQRVVQTWEFTGWWRPREDSRTSGVGGGDIIATNRLGKLPIQPSGTSLVRRGPFCLLYLALYFLTRSLRIV